LRRPVPSGVYARVPCWWSAERWIIHVERVYKRHYLLMRHRLVATTGGGISLRAVLAVAAAHAAAADYTTGRNSWPLLGTTGGERGMTAATGLGERTITRARTFLRLVGLATEVQQGRQRTLPERLDSAARGDTARGWTAVYALHHTSTPPVDNPMGVTAGQTPNGTPPRSGLFTPSASAEKRVSTPPHPQRPPTGDEDGAPRRASTTTGGSGRDAKPARAPGTALMLAWRTDPACPGWARAYAAHRWAGALTAVAAAGWTARDLTQMLVDLTNTGHHILTRPRRPISYLLALLTKVDLHEPPTLTRDLHDAAHRAARAEQTAQRAIERANNDQARQAAIAALSGPGRALAHQVLATTSRAAAQRRVVNRRADTQSRAKLVRPARRDGGDPLQQHEPGQTAESQN